MEEREDLRSVLPFLPLVLRGSSLFWPPAAQEPLKALALGPAVSRVSSGDVLFDALLDLRHSLALPTVSPRAAYGYALFFDGLMSRADARVWFSEVVPSLARLMLRLPSLLESHYRRGDEEFGPGRAGLRVLGWQDAGFVLLSQELVAALLACALFCLFPTAGRDERHLPMINFDHLFAALNANSMQSQEQKVRCLVHYFERICACTPTGFVSFKRKVLPWRPVSDGIAYPEVGFWTNSSAPLCPFRVFSSGLIEDEEQEALEIDFANEYLGGGALSRGCIQEEIRFMINPELIVGMLFMASMEVNEAIEIVGPERFSQHMGYGSSFRFVGDYLDKRPVDSMCRRKTRIVAIDALYSPRMFQYETSGLLREVNKAFCGFLDQSKHQLYLRLSQDSKASSEQSSNLNAPLSECLIKGCPSISSDECIGVSTGNWGCGAFGGNLEIKSMIQWIAASQALRPFINYYTFKEASLERLEEVDTDQSEHEVDTGHSEHEVIKKLVLQSTTEMVSYQIGAVHKQIWTGNLIWLNMRRDFQHFNLGMDGPDQPNKSTCADPNHLLSRLTS